MKTLMGIIVVTLSLFAAPAFAECDLTNVGDLPESVVAELEAKCLQEVAKIHTANESGIVPGLEEVDANTVSEWGVVAQEWAKAMGIAAKELGIAADEFLGTDAGKLTALVIVWTFMGESIVGFGLGVPLLITVIVLCRRIANQSRTKNVVYSDKTNWRGKRKIESIEYYDLDNDKSLAWWISHAAMVAFSIWIVAGVIL